MTDPALKARVSDGLRRHLEVLALPESAVTNAIVHALEPRTPASVFLVTADRSHFVVKFNRGLPSVVRRNNELELWAQQQLHEAGFPTRELLAYDNDVNIYRFVPGTSLQHLLAGDESPDMALDSALRTLKDVHATFADRHGESVGATLPPEYGRELFRYLENDLHARGVPLTKRYRNLLLQRRDQLSVSRLTLCHGNPHPGNVLAEGKRIALIDWKYSRFADPALDVAALLFWPNRRLNLQQVEPLIQRARAQYDLIGFDLGRHIGVYIALHCMRSALRRASPDGWLLDLGFALLEADEFGPTISILRQAGKAT